MYEPSMANYCAKKARGSVSVEVLLYMSAMG